MREDVQKVWQLYGIGRKREDIAQRKFLLKLKNKIMKENLTDRQRDVYAMFAGYIQDNGYAPTYREAAERLGMTAQMVEAHIKNIVAKGWMAYTVKKQRRVELIPKN